MGFIGCWRAPPASRLVMLDWQPRSGAYRVWQSDVNNHVDLLPGQVLMSSIWPSIAGGHRLIDVGGDRMLDWEPQSGHYRAWRIDRANEVDLLPGHPVLESTWGTIRD